MKKVLCLVIALVLLFSFCSCTDKDIHHFGIDYYLESGENCSMYGVTRFVYSPEFVEQYEYIDAGFHYFESKTAQSFVDINRNGGYELGILYIRYRDTVYEEAKATLIENSEYLNEAPAYSYNGYAFYRLNFDRTGASDYKMHAYNDKKGVIVLLGFFGLGKLKNGERQPLGELPDESELPEYLDKYFGEYYDFDA